MVNFCYAYFAEFLKMESGKHLRSLYSALCTRNLEPKSISLTFKVDPVGQSDINELRTGWKAQ